MPFSPAVKLEVKKKADFTCCWCEERRNKVEAHHIIPESEGGPDTEENAAPLCGSCHDLYGMNPQLRKEVTERRDYWYEICAKRIQLIREWPPGLGVPLLDFYHELPQKFGDGKGIQFTDRKPDGEDGPPVLYLNVHFIPPMYRPSRPEQHVKGLGLLAEWRFAFLLGMQVYARNDRDVFRVMKFLRGESNICDLVGPVRAHEISSFIMFKQDKENRLVMSTIMPTNAFISIRAGFSERVASAFAQYLEEVGFAELGGGGKPIEALNI